MKFTNGYWMIRDGVDALYAREAYELAADATTESLNVLAPTSVVRGRYDTLNLPTFNVDITTPAEGVIRVRAEHWQGATEYPGFPLNADEPGNRDYVTVQANGNGDGEVGVNGADVTLTTGGLTAKVVKGTPLEPDLHRRGRQGAHRVRRQVAGPIQARCRIERHRPAGRRIRCDHGRFRP